MNTTSNPKVESSRHGSADLVNKPLKVDGDMDMSALPKTNHITSIVTSGCKMDMERKGVQSYQSQLYVRFLCFGNGALAAIHDKSEKITRNFREKDDGRGLLYPAHDAIDRDLNY